MNSTEASSKLRQKQFHALCMKVFAGRSKDRIQFMAGVGEMIRGYSAHRCINTMKLDKLGWINTSLKIIKSSMEEECLRDMNKALKI